jgi:tetratricopeptide (TPR) repeat protein
MGSTVQQIDPDQFVATVQPVLEQKDAQRLLTFLKEHWTGQQIIALLRSGHEDARKVAALCLSLVGTSKCVKEIAPLLQDEDSIVNQLAEHALWSIWFRGGTPEANHQLARGAQALGRRDTLHAISHFDRAIEISPDFAEAYNQRAIAKFLLDDHEGSLADCRKAIEQMPYHFGAWAGTGHNEAHLGRWHCAMKAYERCLAINPHMTAIREAVRELREKLNHPGDDN